MKPTPWIVLFLLFVLPVALGGQVVARQGDPAESPLQEFKSPMILDLPLKDFKGIPWKAGKDFKEVGRFYCEDLVISRLGVAKREESHRGKPSGMRLDIQGAVTVRPSYDRLATLRFDIVKGEARLATTQVSHLNAEEGKTRSFSAEVILGPEDIERLFAAGADPLLRITVTVQNNS
jgi:hypothetical protein